MPDALDELYAAPLEEFVARRNALAKALRKEGKADEAGEIASRRKPSAAAGVVNRLARDEKRTVASLIRAVDEVKAGKDGADTRFRDAVDELTRAARKLFERDGKRPTDVLLREVATTLRAAAAADPGLLSAGRLESAMEPSGFEAMAGATIRRPAARAKPEPKADRAALVQARTAVDEARAEARALRRRADEAAREAERAATAAAKAEAALRKAEERLARVGRA